MMCVNSPRPVLLFLPFVNFASLAHLSFGYWALLVFLGANTLISYGCLSLALKYLEAGKVSIIIVLNPINAMRPEMRNALRNIA